jgi:hypothetical protein
LRSNHPPNKKGRLESRSRKIFFGDRPAHNIYYKYPNQGDRMPVKKKAAKKTYSAVKKGFPKTKITLEDLVALHAKTEASIDRLTAQNDRTAALVHELTRNMGGLNNSFGTLVEVIVIPKMRAAVNAVGKHTFDRVLVDKKVSALVAGEKKTIGEIDMFLFSDAAAEAMVVEIKAQLSINQVKERLERLQKFREYEEEAEIKGKKLFGAVAAIYIDPKVKAFALENGLYVIEIREEEDKLDIEKPAACRTW